MKKSQEGLLAKNRRYMWPDACDTEPCRGRETAQRLPASRPRTRLLPLVRKPFLRGRRKLPPRNKGRAWRRTLLSARGRRPGTAPPRCPRPPPGGARRRGRGSPGRAGLGVSGLGVFGLGVSRTDRAAPSQPGPPHKRGKCRANATLVEACELSATGSL